MTDPKDLPYTIQTRQMIAETDGLRVQVLVLENEETVPWHYHTEITDTFFCLEGPMVITTKSPDGKNTAHELQVGDSFEVPCPTPHLVEPKNKGRCRFLIVQGIGPHDYIPVDN